MDGMGMLLKAAGFDPEQFQQFVQGMQTTLQKFNTDLDALRNGQREMLNRISSLESTVRILSREPEQENAN